MSSMGKTNSLNENLGIFFWFHGNRSMILHGKALYFLIYDLEECKFSSLNSETDDHLLFGN